MANNTESKRETEAYRDLPRPEVSTIYDGAEETVLQGKSDSAAFMPEHFSTREAIVVVVEGEVRIHYTDLGEEAGVAAGDTHVIQPKVWHSLSADGPFRLFLIYPTGAEIKFED
jgi:quercetin dioxygenase-like cupin family protein